MRTQVPPRAAASTPRRQRGATLIEALVSVFIISIGLLGAAALQNSALRNNQSSYERTQTAILSQTILDAMRANPEGVTAGGYTLSSFTCTAPTGTTLAAADLGAWITRLQTQLNASACGRIACTNGTCTVDIRWDDSRSTGGSSAQTVSTRVQL